MPNKQRFALGLCLQQNAAAVEEEEDVAAAQEKKQSNEPENRINYLSNRAKPERTLTVRVCQTICSCISKHK